MTLFSPAQKLSTFLENRLKAALQEAHSADMSTATVEALAENIIEQYRVEPLEVHRDKLTQLAASNDTVVMGRRAFPVRYRLPCTGTPELWSKEPSNSYLNPDFLFTTKMGGDDHLIITMQLPALNLATDIYDDKERLLALQAEQQKSVQDTRDAHIEQLQKMVNWSGNQTNTWNDSLSIQIRRTLKERAMVADEAKRFAASSDVPVFRVDEAEQVPLQPGIVRRKLRPEASATEATLATEIYEDIVQTIEQMTRAMERTPTAARLGEEEIRDLILFVLNANYRGAAAGEVFNGNGKTDILLRWNDQNAFIGECKFWEGPARFRRAIDQLHGYVTWRDTKAALILFVKAGKPTDIIDKAAGELRKHRTFVDEAPHTNGTRRDFVLSAADDDAKHIDVALVVVIRPAR